VGSHDIETRNEFDDVIRDALLYCDELLVCARAIGVMTISARIAIEGKSRLR